MDKNTWGTINTLVLKLKDWGPINIKMEAASILYPGIMNVTQWYFPLVVYKLRPIIVYIDNR